MSFFDATHPLVFAHRGSCVLGPENTFAAFDAGLQAGADGLEVDVHLSADGVVVVHHDATLDRTTNGRGPVSARTADELARLDAAYHCCIDGRYPWRGQGLGVPTLREVLRRYAEARIIIEMKGRDPALGEAVARELRAAGAVERACGGSFCPGPVRALRAALPEVATSAHRGEVRVALYRSWLHVPARSASYGGYQVPEVSGSTRVVSPRFVRHAHEAGLKVQVWTIDREVDMRRLLDWGVDALISNRADVAVRVRDQWRHPA